MWFDARSNGSFLSSMASKLKVKGFLEYSCYNKSGQGQGTALVHLSKVGRVRSSGCVVSGSVVCASDEYYSWYATNRKSWSST